MKTLFVYYEKLKVGILSCSEDLTYTFAYEDKWRKHAGAFPLSLSMPLDQKEFGNRITLSFFENLLPEGGVRRRLEQAKQIKGPFSFLEQFGRDVAGAVVLTSRDAPPETDPTARVAVDMAKVYQAVRDREPVAEVIAEMNPGYLSLAGAQDKFAAIFEDGEFFLPGRGGATTHIVKAPIQRKGVSDTVYNEYYCMQLAKAVGLNVPHTQVVDSELPLFIIERYDRKHVPGQPVRRLHQQDFCQAQGVTSDAKYEALGGPTLQNNYALIRENVTVRRKVEDIKQFFSWLSFNLIIGNNDCHAKNLSFLLVGGKIQLSPFYDLMSTAIYANLDRHFAYKIGGRARADQLGRKQFEVLETQFDIRPGVFRDHIRQIAELIENRMDPVAEAVATQFPAAKVQGRIISLIQKRIKGLRERGAK
ncbi:MAG: hypothetical protein C5B49_05415 [Bdellovibrio sp.]|nr:MAG: hypothetical protein C5B49_05415 [Bdellovibrio sp.]